MALFDFSRAGAIRQQLVPSSVIHSVVPHAQPRIRPRVGLGAVGTALVLMGVAMGVLTIRFILVVAHTFLQ